MPVYKPVQNLQNVAQAIADTIITQLADNKSVLWLVPGGSSIAVAILAARKIAAIPHSKLTVTLTDERYGPVGHRDSNWQQLTEAGFRLPEAQLLPVLKGFDRARTTEEFATALQHGLKTADFTLGFFGMGTDGHTAGILPGSPAARATQFAFTYDAPNFERITITPLAITELDEAIVYATGKAKWPALKKLEEPHTINDQPAQVLKQIPKLTIFTDYGGREL
jgi:6-phosphogluconolactonase/glucosamine-6-phosphate isomerase/deaminase